MAKLLMAAYMSAELGKTLDFPPAGLAEFVPTVAKGTWKPQRRGTIMKRRTYRSKTRFSCGHPRTPENTRVARGRGYTWGKCRICDNKYMRAYMRRRARQRLRQRVAALEHAIAKSQRVRGERADA